LKAAGNAAIVATIEAERVAWAKERE